MLEVRPFQFVFITHGSLQIVQDKAGRVTLPRLYAMHHDGRTLREAVKRGWTRLLAVKDGIDYEEATW